MTENGQSAFTCLSESGALLPVARDVLVASPTGRLYRAVPAMCDKRDEESSLLPTTSLLNTSLNEGINQFRRQRQLFFLLLLAELLCEAVFHGSTLAQRAQTWSLMRRLYVRAPLRTVMTLFWAVLSVETLFAVIYFTVGVLGAARKSLWMLDLFNLLCLAGMITAMMQAYILRFNTVAFFFRVLLFMHSKHLCDLLLKIYFAAVGRQ